MSLIADALKAAQGERSKTGQGGDGSKRRVMASSVLNRSARGDRYLARRSAGMRMPKPLGIATAVFASAVVVAVGVIAIAPGGGDSERAEDLASTAPAAERGPEVASPPPAVSPVASTGGAGAAAAADMQARDPVEPRSESAGGLVDRAKAFGERAAPVDRARGLVDRASAATGPAEEPPVQAAVDGPSGTLDVETFAGAGAEGATPTEAAGHLRLSVEPARRPAIRAGYADAVAAHRSRDYARAVAMYREVLAANPADAEVLNSLGSALQAMGQQASARDAFRQAVEVDPSYAAAWSNLSVSLAALGEAEQAQAALGEAVRLDPSNRATRVNLANQYLERGLTAEAKRLLNEVLREDPLLAEAHYALARLMEREGDQAGAIRHYRRFLENSHGRFPTLDGPVRTRIAQLAGASG